MPLSPPPHPRACLKQEQLFQWHPESETALAAENTSRVFGLGLSGGKALRSFHGLKDPAQLVIKCCGTRMRGCAGAGVRVCVRAHVFVCCFSLSLALSLSLSVSLLLLGMTGVPDPSATMAPPMFVAALEECES